MSTKEYLIEYDQVRLVKPKIVLEVLNSLDKAIENVSKKKTWKRKRFVIGFLFWTGVRVSEMIMTIRRDIDLVNKLYYVPTLKHRREKKMTISLAHIPSEELAFWEQWFSENKLGSDDPIIRMTRQGIHKLVRTTFQEYNYENVSPHMLRHSIAVMMALNNVPLNALQRFLRHKKATTTSIYYQITGQDLAPILMNLRQKHEKQQLTLI